MISKRMVHHHRGNPPFFLFRGLRLYGVYPSFRTYGVYLFPLFSQENGMHHSFFCSVTSGSGDRPRKEGCHGGGVYSFSPCGYDFSCYTGQLLHRAFWQESFCVIRPPPYGTFCERQLHRIILWELIFQLHAHLLH